jgi:hypothetical protein
MASRSAQSLEGDEMTTRLESPLKREFDVRGEPYTLTITPQGLTLVRKGKRKGQQLAWESLVSGEAALATALNASLLSSPAESEKSTTPKP